MIEDEQRESAESEGEKLDLPKDTVIVLRRTRGYAGRFPFRVPTLADEMQIGAEIARLCDGVPLESMPPGPRLMSNALAYMRVLSMPQGEARDIRPEWWFTSNEGGSLFKTDPVLEYFKEGRSYESRFHGEDEESDGDRGESEVERSEASPAADDDRVERPVQPAAKRRKVVVPNAKRTRRADHGKEGRA